MDTLLLILLIFSFVIIALLIFLLLRFKSTGNAESQAAIALAEKHLNLRMQAYESSTAQLLEETRRQYERQIDILRQRLDRQAEELQQRSAMQFSNLANEVLDRQTDKLSRINRHDIDNILSPLRENISDFRKAVMDSYVNENAAREALSAKIESLSKANVEVSRETRRLTNALRGNNAAQGKWGEIVLEQILENGGLIKGTHYSTQTSVINGVALRDEDGKSQRPDVILYLPGNHLVVIDSKTSLTSYLKAVEAENNDVYEAEMKNHALSARKHVDELATKQYHKNIPGALEHTIMFMPNDAAYLAALRADASLSDYAAKRNIVIVSPTHLLSVIQIITQIWRVENQNQNAEKIAEQGGKLYDKIAAFMTDFMLIDKSIQNSAKAYDKCYRHLTGGYNSILTRTEKLKNMGAKTTRQLPPDLISPDEDPENQQP